MDVKVRTFGHRVVDLLAETASLLHSCWTSGIHGADYAVAVSGGGDWGFYLLGAESESGRIFDRAFGGCDGETDRGLAD
jgi:hypothetical protein